MVPKYFSQFFNKFSICEILHALMLLQIALVNQGQFNALLYRTVSTKFNVMDYAEKFEQIIIDEIILIAKEKGLNHSQLARRAFGDVEKSIGRWRNFRIPRKNTGKPQSLTFADAYKLCDALGIEIGTLLFRANERFKLKYNSAHQK